MQTINARKSDVLRRPLHFPYQESTNVQGSLEEDKEFLFYILVDI